MLRGDLLSHGPHIGDWNCLDDVILVQMGLHIDHLVLTDVADDEYALAKRGLVILGKTVRRFTNETHLYHLP